MVHNFLYLKLGEISSKHIQIFRSNQFFRGISIPEPEEQLDLKKQMAHYNATPEVIDFLLVCVSFI